MTTMLTYDLMESARNTSQWLGATARAWGAYVVVVLALFLRPSARRPDGWPARP